MTPSNKKKHSKPKPAKPTPTSDKVANQPTTTSASLNTTTSKSSSEQRPIITTAQPTAPTSSMAESVSTVDFDFFLENASFFDIQHFLHEIPQSMQSTNLRRLWKRAFQEGRRQGFQDGLISRDKIDIDTLFDKYFEGGRKEGRTEGEEFGRQMERQTWLSAGHGAGECTPTSKRLSSTSTTTQTKATIPTESSTQMEPLNTADLLLSTDPSSIDNLCSRAALASSDTALGAVWTCAFKQGQDRGMQIRDAIPLIEAVNIGVERGRIAGIRYERKQWEAAGHSQTCLVTNPPTTTSEIGTQVDHTTPALCITVSADVQASPPHSDISTQTPTDFNSPDPHRVDNVVQAVAAPPPHLNWAEDAESLPTHQLRTSPLHQPRDLSILRSASSYPFSSLQRRSKMRNAHQSRRRHHHPFYSESPDPPPHRYPLYPITTTYVCQKHETQNPKRRPSQRAPSNLDWDSDPRLYDLSRSLRALGWFRVP